MYHCDEARPVENVVDFRSKNRLRQRIDQRFHPRLLTGSSPDLLYPIQIALDPGVNQPEKKNADEKQNLNQSENPHSAFNPAPKHRSNGEEKGDFNFENDKDQRYR